MSCRYRAYPATEQVDVLTRHCPGARYVWNLALEQANYCRPGRAAPPGPAKGSARRAKTKAAIAGIHAHISDRRNRGIARSCWGAFERRLTDKANASGVAVVFVDPRYTSLQCRACGHTAAQNREGQAVFACVACGHRAHADAHAAPNILARGPRAPARAPGRGAYAHVSPSRMAVGTSGKAAA
ncbi:MAG: zinc ribbon domain-containing protein [Candidatus Dormibacteria bacterium]